MSVFYSVDVFQQTVMGSNMCFYSRRCAPLFVRDRFHTVTSQEKRKEASQIIQFLVPLYR